MDRAAVDAHLEVEVRARRVAGAADVPITWPWLTDWPHETAIDDWWP